MALALVLVPLAFAACAAAMPWQRWRPWLLPVCGAAQRAAPLWTVRHTPVTVTVTVTEV